MAQTNDDKTRIAQAVSAMLRDRGIGRETAAEQTGIPYRTMRRRLDGIGKGFDIDELAKVAGLLDVSLVEIFTYADEAEPVSA